MYVKIKNEHLKMPYGSGRLPMKVSLTDEVLAALEKIGVIEREKSHNGRIVAKRGGYGSALAEVSLRLMFDILSKESEGQSAKLLFDMVDKNDLVTVVDNLGKIHAILRQRLDGVLRAKSEAKSYIDKIDNGVLSNHIPEKIGEFVENKKGNVEDALENLVSEKPRETFDKVTREKLKEAINRMVQPKTLSEDDEPIVL